MQGLLPATRSSTASVIGTSPCGDNVAGRPLTLSVGARSPARPPKHSTAGIASSLSCSNVSVCTLTGPPRAVTYSATSIPPSSGRQDTGVTPSVNRTMPSLPLNIARAAQRFHPLRSKARKSTACG
eukprot:4406288-Pleurochrysis_carterae.AAC.1